MTRISIRIRRAGIWEAVDVDELSDLEWDDFDQASKDMRTAADHSVAGWRLARELARWIGEHAPPRPTRDVP